MKNFILSVLVVACLSACSTFNQTAPKVSESYYQDDAERYRQNVAVKAQTESFVTYEYKDIRIDELAPLAADYCYNMSGKQAYLREVILYRNNLRRATFDCVSLAIQD